MASLPPKPNFWTVVLSSAAVVAAAMIRITLDPWLGLSPPFIFFIIPVILGAWYGGYKTGIYATLLSGLVGWFFFVPPLYGFGTGTPDAWIRLGLFMLACAVISGLIHKLQATRVDIQASERRFRSTFENAAVGIAHIAVDGHWLRVNQRLCDILGYSRNQLRQRKFEEITHPDDLKLDLQLGEELLAGRRDSYQLEKRFRRKDGSHVWVNLTVSLQRDRTGHPEFFISVIEDISARKRAEQASELNLKQLRAAFEGMAEPALMLDTRGQVIAINSAYNTLFGLERAPHNREELIQDFEFTNPDGSALEMHQSAYERALCGEVVREMELRACRRDTGQVMALVSGAAPIRDSAGEVMAVIITSHDITLRKSTQEALQRSNLVLKQFAYAAAHDLQEPLRNVALATDLLVEKYRGQLTPEADRLLDTSLEGARRMHRMIEDLLLYTQTVEMKPVDAPLVRADAGVDQALDQLRQAVEQSGAVITRDVLPSVRIHPLHLVQLFQNLISNSLKYKKAGQPARIHIGVEQNGTDWIFSVRDEGIGFDESYREQIFGLFARLHTRREYAGNGIGLAICARIVEQYGGRIWAESVVGQGATFYFTLPAYGAMVAS